MAEGPTPFFVAACALTTAVAASAADSAIDHLSPQEEVRQHGHAQTWVLSAQISCSAVALNRFGQIDTTSSYLGGGPAENGTSPKFQTGRSARKSKADHPSQAHHLCGQVSQSS